MITWLKAFFSLGLIMTRGEKATERTSIPTYKRSDVSPEYYIRKEITSLRDEIKKARDDDTNAIAKKLAELGERIERHAINSGRDSTAMLTSSNKHLSERIAQIQNEMTIKTELLKEAITLLEEHLGVELAIQEAVPEKYIIKEVKTNGKKKTTTRNRSN